MKRLIRMGSAVLALACGAAFAQSAHTASTCPSLPQGSGLKWSLLEGPGFLFCKALRDTDGGEAFAVTLSRSSPFKPRRRDRAERADIAGGDGWWYRSEIAGNDGAIARETLVEVDAQRVAHISLRAASEDAKAQAMRQVQALRFEDARLSSN